MEYFCLLVEIILCHFWTAGLSLFQMVFNLCVSHTTLEASPDAGIMLYVFGLVGCLVGVFMGSLFGFYQQTANLHFHIFIMQDCKPNAL